MLENSFQSSLSTHSFVDRFVTDLGLTVPQREKKEQAPSDNRRCLPPPPGKMLRFLNSEEAYWTRRYMYICQDLHDSIKAWVLYGKIRREFKSQIKSKTKLGSTYRSPTLSVL